MDSILSEQISEAESEREESCARRGSRVCIWGRASAIDGRPEESNDAYVRLGNVMLLRARKIISSFERESWRADEGKRGLV